MAHTTVLYHCPHLDPPHGPLSPEAHPSSSASLHALPELYFCEECDAVRCNLCVGVEVASYFCPSCLFDVPSANVRADKNRCARSCFSCPQCASSLQVQAADPPAGDTSTGTGPFLLICPGCKWSSREVGWEFEKSSGLAQQLARVHSAAEVVQSEFDSLKDHLETYLSSSAPTPAPSSRTRHPTRHISHLTQMAAKALHREIPGMAAASARTRGGRNVVKSTEDRVGWDEMKEYEARGRCAGMEVDKMVELEELREAEWAGTVAGIEQTWTKSWDSNRRTKALLPQRIPLQTKLTKRCPAPTCRHLLIQPDSKSTRMKIKMVAANYLPAVELGRRRRRIVPGDVSEVSAEDVERRRRERRKTRGAKEEDEVMTEPLRPGEVYTFQLALTNPLYDPIQIRLTHAHAKFSGHTIQNDNAVIHIVTPHFTINALKDAWAYDEEEDEEEADFEGTEASEEASGSVATGSGSGSGTVGRKGARMSLLAGGSVRDKGKERRDGVERKGNVSKVGVEVEVSPQARGLIEFDLEVRYTYRSDEGGEKVNEDMGVKDGAGAQGGAEGYKTFTFWVRVNAGKVEPALVK